MIDPKIYKEGQGAWARNSVAATIAVFAVFVSIRTYDSLFGPQAPMIESSLFETWLRVTSWPFDYRLAVVGPLLLGLLFFGWWQYNHPQWADFLIETENELKNRVTWPSRREQFNASLVVVVAVIIFAAFIFGSDLGLHVIFDNLVYRGLSS